MTVSKKQQACIARYNAKAYEEIKVRVKKGEKATLQAIAKEQGTSVNGLITAALDYYLDYIKGGTPTKAEPPTND